jgi:hypothetical protein
MLLLSELKSVHLWFCELVYRPVGPTGNVFVIQLKARLQGSPRLINTVESMKLNSRVERYCLHGYTEVNEAVVFKMAANELVREGVVVICDYLINCI